MHYLNIGLDDAVSVFDICQAHAQLESDYNVGGIVRERPSNQRRNESTGCQLSRIGYRDNHRWVDICAERDDGDDPVDDAVSEIYMQNVLKWGLPIDAELMAAIKRTYVSDFVAQYHQCEGEDYLQGRSVQPA